MELAPERRIDAEVDNTIDLVNRMVRQAQSGDGEAFEGVYRAHVGRIHALCLRMSGDSQYADSLTQDVFVRA
jgi:RNA polymerase sigma-70 factor (ECF subfamily)